MAENSQVKAIIDFLQTMGKDLVSSRGLYIYVSKLDKRLQNDNKLNGLKENFAEIINQNKAKLFDLPNGDIFLVFSKDIQDELSSSLVKARFSLQEDENVAASADLIESKIVEYIDLVKEYGQLLSRLAVFDEQEEKEIVENKKINVSNVVTKRENRQFLTTAMLDKVQKIIAVSDFSSFIRRQSVCAVIGKSQPQRVFEEVYVSIPDMQDSLLPNVDINSDPWLFLALTETLDRRVLEIISRHDDGALRGNFSININVSTILSDAFLRFDDTIDPSMLRTVVLELQLEDIFGDMRSYDLARAFARARGYRICIDNISVEKLIYVNRTNLDCDLMKIIWHPDFVNIISQDKHFMDYENKNERAKMIICRVDDETAVEVGNSLGINLYQGRYIQKMLNKG